jgi:O-antigen/teichoic acid export membrane protein
MNKLRNLDATSRYLLIRFTSLVVSGILQLLLPVFFIRNYGSSVYGLWVLIFSIGNIFSMSDFGWIASLSISAIHEKANSSQKLFQETLYKISKIGKILSWNCLLCGSLLLLTFKFVSPFSFTDPKFIVCMGSIISTSCLIRLKALEAIFRANGSTLGFTLLTANYLANSLITLLLVLVKIEISIISTIIAISSFLFVFFTEFTCASHLKTHKLSLVPTKSLGIKKNNWANALGYFSFPLSYLILNEGINIVVAFALGTESLGQLAFIRTYVGIFRQITTLFTDSYLPSFAELIGSKNIELANVSFLRMKRKVYFLNFCIFVVFIVLVEFSKILERSAGEIPKEVFLLFCASAMLDVPWNVYISIPSAINDLARLAIRFFFSCFTTIIIALSLLQMTGLVGVAIALVVPDVVMTLKTRRHALRILQSI